MTSGVLAAVVIAGIAIGVARATAEPAATVEPAALPALRVTTTASPAAPAPRATGPATKPSPTPARDDDRASRSGLGRAPSPSPTTMKTTQRPEVSGSGTVTATGTCEASYYGDPQPTASGEVFDPEAMTAAHKSWKFGTRVRVTNLRNDKSVVVRINDRGPYIDGRCIDLSTGAFRVIESLDAGVADIRYEVLG